MTGVVRRWFIAIVALMAVAGFGWLLGHRAQSPAEAAARSAAPVRSWVTVRVERRVLSQTVITRGDVRPKTEVRIGVPSSVEGEPIITNVPMKPGDAVADGDRVLEISGRPVFVLQGDVPAYRSLKPGDVGHDVVELQLGLQRLGCRVANEPGVYGHATKDCVAALYRKAGYEPVPVSPTDTTNLAAAQQAVADTQTALASSQFALDKAQSSAHETTITKAQLDLDQARRDLTNAEADAADALTAAQSELDGAQATFDKLHGDPDAAAKDVSDALSARDAAQLKLNSTKRSGNAAVDADMDAITLAQAVLNDTRRPPDVSVELSAMKQAHSALTAAETHASLVSASTGATVPRGEVVFVPELPVHVQSIPASVGPIAASGSPDAVSSPPPTGVATLSSGGLVLAVTFHSDQRPLVRIGTPVKLLDEGTTTAYNGTILAVDDKETVGADHQAGFAAVVAPTAGSSLPYEAVGTSLRVTITAASTDAETLVVPTTAVSSRADGSNFVSVVPAGALVTTDPSVAPVKVGLSADGFVAVEPIGPPNLAVGDRVVVGK
jgi:multidrug efflux pump subunit AcrA (membrane-fusion protein)